MLSKIIVLFCGCSLFARISVAGLSGGMEMSLWQFSQPTFLDSHISLSGTKKSSSVFSTQHQWFIAPLPNECSYDDCSLRLTEPLLRGVECTGQSPCQITSSDPYQLTFSDIRPGTVLHIYPSPDDPETKHQYVVFSDNRQPVYSPYDTLSLDNPLLVFENRERERQWHSDQLIPAVPAIHCNNDTLSFYWYPFRKVEQTLAVFLLRLLILPVNKPPQIVFHFEQCYRNKLELRNFMALYGLEKSVPGILRPDFTRQVSDEQNTHPQEIMVFREEFDPATDKKTILVWRNNQWQTADDGIRGWVHGLNHVEELDRLFSMDTSGSYGFDTPHNQHLRAIMDRMHEEQNWQASRKKSKWPQKSSARKAADTPPDSGHHTETNDDHCDDEHSEETVAPDHRGEETQSSDTEPGDSPVSRQNEQPPVLGETSNAAGPDSLPPMPALSDITVQTGFLDAGNGVKIIKWKNEIYRHSDATGNQCALLSPVIRSGIHKWTLEVRVDFGASICIGVAHHGFQLSQNYKNNPINHIYMHKGLYLWRSYQGWLYQDGKKLAKRLDALGWEKGKNVNVKCEVDVSNRTLKIFKNDQPLGVAFENLSFPLQACVCLYAQHQKQIILKQYLCSEPATSGVSAVSGASAASEVLDIPSASPGSERTHFEPTKGWGSFICTDDKMTLARKREHSGNVLCGLNCEMSAPGCYSFAFVVQQDQGASTCIGVASPRALNASEQPERGNVYTCRSTYLYRTFQGMLHSNGGVVNSLQLPEAWLSGSLVGMDVIINQDKQVKVIFTINEKKQPEWFLHDGISVPLVPVVGFYAGMEKKLTLVHFQFTPAGIEPYAVGSQTPRLNDLNTDLPKTDLDYLNHSIFLKKSDLSPGAMFDECVKCRKQVNILVLPCLHGMYCEDHLVANGTVDCIICDQAIKGCWNLLCDDTEHKQISPP